MNSKAYTEVNFIINEMDSELSNKIPRDIKEMIRKKMDKNYEFCIENHEWEEKELLEDTEKILSVLYTDYIANDEEKKLILNKEKIINQERHKDIKIIKNSQELFPNQRKYVSEEKSLVKTENKPWILKIVEYIKLKF